MRHNVGRNIKITEFGGRKLMTPPHHGIKNLENPDVKCQLNSTFSKYNFFYILQQFFIRHNVGRDIKITECEGRKLMTPPHHGIKNMANPDIKCQLNSTFAGMKLNLANCDFYGGSLKSGKL